MKKLALIACAGLLLVPGVALAHCDGLDGPVVTAAGKALETGDVKLVLEKSKYAKNDVPAGREYVKAYVEYIHYVEQLYESTKGPAEGHENESAEAGQHSAH